MLYGGCQPPKDLVKSILYFTDYFLFDLAGWVLCVNLIDFLIRIRALRSELGQAGQTSASEKSVPRWRGLY